jgi:hypothetical protein
MNAYKVEMVLAEDGALLLQNLPFHAGDAVEVIVLERPKTQEESESTLYPLRGKQPYRYDEPFEPATPLEDWEALK